MSRLDQPAYHFLVGTWVMAAFCDSEGTGVYVGDFEMTGSEGFVPSSVDELATEVATEDEKESIPFPARRLSFSLRT